MKDRNSVAAPRRARRGWCVGLFALALTLLPASSALAAEVDAFSSGFGSTVVVFAQPGEVNNLVVQGNRGAITIADSAGGPVTDNGTGFGIDDPECTQDAPNQVTCSVAALPAGSNIPTWTGVFVFLADGNDTLNVTGSLDALSIGASGGDGNDNMSAGVGFANAYNGNAGDDTLTGGRFGDDLEGDAGNDVINGGQGGDFLLGGFGNDNVQGEGGADFVSGGGNEDTVGGGAGGDTVNGDDGNDLVNGGDGDDSVSGGRDVDNVQGDGGDDAVFATEDQIADTYGGGPGNDTIDYSGYGAGVTLSLDGAPNDGAAENDAVDGTFENAFSGNGDDALTGNDQFNILVANDGNDVISGLGGDDTEFAGGGADVLNGGEGRDFLGGGADNDVMNGDNGDDDLAGATGADTFNGAGGNDTADYSGTGANVVVTLDKTANDGSQNELDNADADGSVENILGGGGDDSITGNAVVNFLDGGPGNDQVNARDGTFLTDVVSCGPGYDVAAADSLDSVDKQDVNRCELAPDFPIVRVKPTISIKVSPKTNRKFPKTFTVSGSLKTGAVPTAAACASDSFVAIRTKRSKNTISTRTINLSATCTFKVVISFTDRKRLGTSKKLTFQAVFSGNRFLTSNSKSTTATIR
jgi:Ca2+-binding RTX toxin-like protein